MKIAEKTMFVLCFFIAANGGILISTPPLGPVLEDVRGPVSEAQCQRIDGPPGQMDPLSFHPRTEGPPVSLS